MMYDEPHTESSLSAPMRSLDLYFSTSACEARGRTIADSVVVPRYNLVSMSASVDSANGFLGLNQASADSFLESGYD